MEPKNHRDDRGFFCEVLKRNVFEGARIDADFVQDNQSFSHSSGVMRELHLQTYPHAQGKSMRVVRGSIFDVALDILGGSPTFGQHVSAVLSAEVRNCGDRAASRTAFVHRSRIRKWFTRSQPVIRPSATLAFYGTITIRH